MTDYSVIIIYAHVYELLYTAKEVVACSIKRKILCISFVKRHVKLFSFFDHRYVFLFACMGA